MAKLVTVNLKNDGTISSIGIDGIKHVQFGGVDTAKLNYGRIQERLLEEGYIKTGDEPHAARFEKATVPVVVVKEAVALVSTDGTVRQVQIDGQRYDGVWSKKSVTQRLHELGYHFVRNIGPRRVYALDAA